MSDKATEALKGNLLIVDDKPANLRLLASMLVKQGYKVRSAINGALALTATQAAPPDMILLDINMPKMNGYEVCERLKADESTRDIPIIFISALDETQDKVNVFGVGGVDYIIGSPVAALFMDGELVINNCGLEKAHRPT